ncbi:type I-F CRISPR-associated protein Csy2 [Thioalkalivibrio sp.]|uniref:type I-F CRISPR-associated protein Csy2 n=1 Tax=Thioalkalivibrio sp. TaxID=2093813 RepID=UPI00356580B9
MLDEPQHLLEIPRLRVQNANAISSPMTWGFPAMSAFVGLMHTLERALVDRGVDIVFDAVGVICHRIEPQITEDTFPITFRLTRNPVGKDGATAAIVEEGRTHLKITLVFAVRGDAGPEVARAAEQVVHQLRIAGGTVQPPLHDKQRRWPSRIIPMSDDPAKRPNEYRRLLRRWLPGFTLVARDDLLQGHLQDLRQEDPECSLLDAWLDLARLNMECRTQPPENDEEEPRAQWEARLPRETGWFAPIPVGYGALGPLLDPGSVKAARDPENPFRFVESLYSIGQWLSPHRLTTPTQLLWYPDSDPEQGRYRLQNDFTRHNTPA